MVSLFRRKFIREAGGGERGGGRGRRVRVQHLQKGEEFRDVRGVVTGSVLLVITSARLSDLADGAVGVSHLHRHHRDVPRRHGGGQVHGCRRRHLG